MNTAPQLKDLYQTRIYRIWVNMKTRCHNPNTAEYHRYGGRGITVCAEWAKFENFYRDMAQGYSDDLTLDRIDNDGNYEPSNCRWATMQEQMVSRSTSKLITIGNRTQTLTQWIREMGAKSSTVRQRFYVYGWSAEKSLGMEG